MMNYLVNMLVQLILAVLNSGYYPSLFRELQITEHAAQPTLLVSFDADQGEDGTLRIFGQNPKKLISEFDSGPFDFIRTHDNSSAWWFESCGR